MKLALILFMLIVATHLTAQSGWKTVKDKSGVCKISVPASWTPLYAPGLVNSPQGTTTTLTSGNRPFKPFSAGTFEVLNIDTVFENSSARIIYVGKPSRNPSLVSYHVEAPGRVNSCIAEITLPPNTSEDDAERIALSLSKIR